MTRLRVRPISAADREAWMPLFRDYREFCGRHDDPELLERIWRWVLDPAHEVRALAVECDGDVVGIAHYRSFARTVDGDCGLHLDDLYVADRARGTGAAGAVLERLGEIARDEGAAFVRWVTDEQNEGARRLYERVAAQTRWVTFELAPAAQACSRPAA